MNLAVTASVEQSNRDREREHGEKSACGELMKVDPSICQPIRLADDTTAVEHLQEAIESTQTSQLNHPRVKSRSGIILL